MLTSTVFKSSFSPGGQRVTGWTVGAFRGSEESTQSPGNRSAAADRSVLTSCLDLLLFPCRQAQFSQVLAQPPPPAHHSSPSLLDHLELK